MTFTFDSKFELGDPMVGYHLHSLRGTPVVYIFGRTSATFPAPHLPPFYGVIRIDSLALDVIILRFVQAQFLDRSYVGVLMLLSQLLYYNERTTAWATPTPSLGLWTVCH